MTANERPPRYPPDDIAHPLLPELSAQRLASMAVGGFGMYLLLKVRGLLILPLYARLLDPSEMGVVALGAALGGFVPAFLHLGLPAGSLVQLAALSEPGRVARAYGTFLRVAVASTLLLTVLFGAGILVPGWVPGLGSLSPHALALSVMLVGIALRDVGSVVPQIRQETGFLTLANLLVEYGGALLAALLLFLGYGAAGVFWGSGLALCAGAALLIRHSNRACGVGRELDPTFLRAALGVGVPALAVVVCQWSLQSADRLFLSRFHGQESVGIYSVCWTLASGVMVVGAAVNLVYVPVSSRLARANRDEFVRFVQRCLRLTSALLGLAVASAFLLQGVAMRLVAGPTYAEGAPLLPWLVLVFSLATLMQLLQWIPITIAGRSALVARRYFLTAAVGLALNAAVVPGFGAPGAVAAALVAHGVGFVLLASEARRSCAPAVGGSWRLGTVVVTALAALAAVELQLPTTTPLPWAILSASVLAGAYGLVAWALRLVTPQDLSPIVALWQSRGGLAKSRAATD